MKKLILAVFLLTATTAMVTLSTQHLYAKSGGKKNRVPASQVPAAVQKAFKSQYPSADQLEWEFKPVYYGTPVYTASFRVGSQKWEANYTSSGSLVSAFPR